MLWEKTNYNAGINYLRNTFIREYDISKANISVLLLKNVIDNETYQYLYESERMVRQKYVGKLIKANPAIYEVLKEGITDARRMLFESNSVSDFEVLSIKNDAVFIIGRQLVNTDFGLIRFANKNQYTGYMTFMNMELYYWYNSMTKEERLDIKGIGKEKLIYHEEYMLSFIRDVFFLMQTSTIQNVIEMIKDFYIQYVTYQLPVEYYRKLSIDSNYHYKASPFMNTGFDSITAEDRNKQSLDITWNLEIIKNIQKIIVQMAIG